MKIDASRLLEIALLSCSLLAGSARCESPNAADASYAAEKKQLAEAKALAEARYVAQERECRTHFVVTPCLDEARRERRQSLDALKSRQIEIDEAQRRDRAAARTSELESRDREIREREAERLAHPPEPAASRVVKGGPGSDRDAKAEKRAQKLPPDGAASGPGSASARANRTGKAQEPKKKVLSPLEREANEADKRAQFEGRQEAAARHRQEVEEKQKSRPVPKRPPVSLPIPDAASLPAR